MIVIFVICVIGSLLLGLGRKLSGDILHLVSAVSAASISWALPLKAGDGIRGFLKKVVPEMISGNGCLMEVFSQLLNPALLALEFMGLFILIGLITHIIGNIIPEKKKPNIIAKLILCVLAGLLIGYVLAMPLAYYPAKAEKLFDAAETLGIEIPLEKETLSKYQADEKMYTLVLGELDSFNYEGVEFSVEELINDIAVVNELKPLITNTNRWNEIFSFIDNSEISNAFYCMLLSDEASGNDVIDNLASINLSMSEKISGTKTLFKWLAVMFDRESTFLDIKDLMKKADQADYKNAAAICRMGNLMQLYHNIGRNAPLIGSIFREIADMKDTSDEKLEKEAEALAYFLIPQENQSLVFDFNNLDINSALNYIINSELLRNAIIDVTQSGTHFNPCNMINIVEASLASKIIKTATTKFGIEADSDLYKSLKAYFAILK
ncbi:MAG: hypothetical protein IJM15_05275 [Erysipelotrichaceae bacterium]|nr:hypothetical protein [Erysipelotrichaceae bacterium]